VEGFINYILYIMLGTLVVAVASYYFGLYTFLSSRLKPNHTNVWQGYNIVNNNNSTPKLLKYDKYDDL